MTIAKGPDVCVTRESFPAPPNLICTQSGGGSRCKRQVRVVEGQTGLQQIFRIEADSKKFEASWMQGGCECGAGDDSKKQTQVHSVDYGLRTQREHSTVPEHRFAGRSPGTCDSASCSRWSWSPTPSPGPPHVPTRPPPGRD